MKRLALEDGQRMLTEQTTLWMQRLRGRDKHLSMPRAPRGEFTSGFVAISRWEIPLLLGPSLLKSDMMGMAAWLGFGLLTSEIPCSLGLAWFAVTIAAKNDRCSAKSASKPRKQNH